ncbi:hypothetical protein GCM10027265_07870 [Jatrophihabitans fulvus]
MVASIRSITLAMTTTVNTSQRSGLRATAFTRDGARVSVMVTSGQERLLDPEIRPTRCQQAFTPLARGDGR